MATLLLVDYMTRSENGAAYARREDNKIHARHVLGKCFPPDSEAESKHQPQNAQKPQPKSSCKMILNNGCFQHRGNKENEDLVPFIRGTAMQSVVINLPMFGHFHLKWLHSTCEANPENGRFV